MMDGFPEAASSADKQPFEIDRALDLVRAAVAPFPPAAMFALADDGYGSLFEQLAACVISIRTYDEVSLPAAKRLFAAAPTPAEVATLDPATIEGLIRPATFAERKAVQLKEIARRTVVEHGGVLPCEEAVLTGFAGVGPKCAHLALGVACGLPYISVDVHVHRVANRWGYVQASTPERTMLALEERLPAEHRVEINRLLVPFGKHVCTGVRPKCSTCPVLEMCQRVGVTAHR